MIQLTGAGKRFGPKLLFENLDWLITARERVGIVGANGSGKSTLLKVLAGIEGLDYGTMTVQRGITFGYLPQDGLTLSGRSVFDECMQVFAGLKQIEQEIEQLHARLSELDHESAEYDEAAERVHRLEAEFAAGDGYTVESQVGIVLSGLGFGKEDWSRRTEEFSGGWQMRIALAKLLLQKPNLLLLDEPTNHLDLETRNWLEDFLRSYPYAYILISHDRYFLDVTVKRRLEIWNKRVHFYSGNYEKYLAEKQQRIEQLEAAYKNQREKIEQLEAFINRFRAQATKAKQVQSRIKELERIERIEIPPQERTIHFKFPQPKPSGRTVAEVKGLAKSYGAKHVFSGVDFVIERGDRIALVGHNGAGKSTLIKVLAGEEPVTAGEFKLGHNVEVDYFAQDQYKVLDPQARILDDLGLAAPHSTQTELRTLLGCFLFSHDDVFKPIGVLSGGERNRYALARMLLHPSNFLLLDEPTNHLDLRAKDVLLEALAKFNGTVVFVSHDRYFIDKLATRVFEVGAGTVHVFPGNYEDFLWRKQNPAAPTAAEPEPKNLSQPTNGEPAEPIVIADTMAEMSEEPRKKLNPIKVRQMRERASELEEEITKTEAEILECQNALLRYVSAGETQRLNKLLQQRKRDLEQQVGEWEEIAQAIEVS
jgi:ATP-binding cassette subfamily F protein 3